MTETEKLGEIKREERRSCVRIIVTYIAAAYIFIGSAILIAVSLICTKPEILSSAKEIFTMVLPIATGIVTYWFASRKPKMEDAPGKISTQDADKAA